MPLKVIVSERAEKNLDKIVGYLEREWSPRVRDKYLLTIKKKLELTAGRPLMYPASSKRKLIHQCVITKHSILYYRIHQNFIEVITIQDTRQDPKKAKIQPLRQK